MWTLIDKEMTLKECSIFCFDPVEIDEEEDQAIWSLNYFFFNKTRKRVAYIYVKGIAVMSYSPRTGVAKRSASALHKDMGAKKRARYWLGDRADDVTNGGDVDEEDLDSNDGLDADVLDISYGNDFCDEYIDEVDDESDDQNYKGQVRGVSEDIAARMEIEV
jgi:hypothetical protein